MEVTTDGFNRLLDTMMIQAKWLLFMVGLERQPHGMRFFYACRQFHLHNTEIETTTPKDYILMKVNRYIKRHVRDHVIPVRWLRCLSLREVEDWLEAGGTV